MLNSKINLLICNYILTNLLFELFSNLSILTFHTYLHSPALNADLYDNNPDVSPNNVSISYKAESKQGYINIFNASQELLECAKFNEDVFLSKEFGQVFATLEKEAERQYLKVADKQNNVIDLFQETLVESPRT